MLKLYSVCFLASLLLFYSTCAFAGGEALAVPSPIKCFLLLQSLASVKHLTPSQNPFQVMLNENELRKQFKVKPDIRSKLKSDYLNAWDNHPEMEKWINYLENVKNLQIPVLLNRESKINLGDWPVASDVSRRELLFETYISRTYQTWPKLPGEKDVFYIFGHGLDPDHEFIVKDGKNKAVIVVNGTWMTAEEFVPVLELFGYQKGSIRFFSCRVAKGSSDGNTPSFIKDLANILKERAPWIRGAEYPLSERLKPDGTREVVGMDLTAGQPTLLPILSLDGKVDNMKIVRFSSP